MPSKKNVKTKGSNRRKQKQPRENIHPKTRWSSSSYAAAAVALGGAALALGWIGWTHIISRQTNDDRTLLSSKDLLEKIRRPASFELASESDRTLVATADIPAETVLMEVPRDLMIWDLDAARDPFVREELFGAPLLKGESADPMCKRAALLSAYLALLRSEVVSAGQLQTSVARAMPSYEEYSSFHPVLADMMQMENYLGEHSPAFQLLVHVRETLSLEYDSFASSSTKFLTHVSRDDYLTTRIVVQSRAFNIPKLPESELPKMESEFYRQNIGVDFGMGVLSIKPVIDWMNNHVNNNVDVGGYDTKKRRVLAWATKTIHKGAELLLSYGKFNDVVLFGQYGYVPSDGTGTSVASLAVHHNVGLISGMTDTSTKNSLPPLERMEKYLQYDYGYPECIRKETQPHAFELKRLKLLFLQRIALDRTWWVLPLPPRVSTETTPMSTTAVLDDYRVPSFEHVQEYVKEKSLSGILPCRLITLTDEDLDDGAALLREDLDTLKGSSNQLETPALKLERLEPNLPSMVRTLHCMRKLVSEQLQRYGSSVEEQEKYIMTLARNGNTNALEWNAAHVKLEEMQSQETVEKWALAGLDSFSHMENMTPDELFVRDKPCPKLEVDAENAVM